MIMGLHNLPFEVGDEVESRSFIQGFRGAWFRCKIHDIGWRLNQLAHKLEYADFPDESISSRSRKTKLPLMVRPSFPTICHKSEMPDINTIKEVVVIIADSWKVGDLVDWWFDSCYWSGKIIEILGDEKIELLPPPAGEGSTYDVFCKDLRPSLDWSPEYGWTVPTPMESDNGHSCAQIIKPVNQGEDNHFDLVVLAVVAVVTPSMALATMHEGERNGVQPTAQASQYPYRQGAQPLGAMAAVEMQTPGPNMESSMADDSGIGKTSCSDSGSSSHFIDSWTEISGTTDGQDRLDNDGSLEKKRVDENMSLNLMCTDTIEVAILDLEELLSRVKWIKSLLGIGVPLSNSRRPPWKFLEHRASSTPK
ncbi:hypothetical protein FEM48_Zijuj07G0108400 [Ziziphus jujuba var. spinosa]|uniref:Agenet domain-containing protein n=1 Tax=Ziziphus jujuba var. spinosa TaxID=714518 RepID=A0A978V473_ZIZJJ|nr:hypothetical protein FEM48_Zijuj07G0108400 [Ziziphus jujuba var. spinosa]